MKNIGIIGAGRIGSALGKILSDAGHSVKKYDSDPSKSTDDISAVASAADFLFLCVPSWVLKEAAESVKPHFGLKTIVVSLSKGIETTTLKTPYEILKEIFPKKSVVILGGPLIAESIVDGGFGAGVAASESKNSREAVKEIFSGTNVRIETSENPQDVSLSGVLKNIYTTLIGISTGIGMSENAVGFLASESIKEMAGILKSVCGNKDSAFKTECAGDFIATIFSAHSKNMKTGIEMAESGSTQKSEGVSSLVPLIQILGKNSKDFKLLSALAEIIQNKSDPKSEISKLL